MPAPFLTTTVPNMLVAVEVAWGADLSDLTGASWTWSDITADVLGANEANTERKIAIVLGRPDESQLAQTAEMTCELDNRSGAYSDGGMSPNWPFVRRGVPVRVRVSANAGSSWSLRFQGTANGFTPQWDAETGRWATVALSASGPIRRLEQGTPFTASAIRSGTVALRQSLGIVAYWPCEDQAGSKSAAAAIGGGRGSSQVGGVAADAGFGLYSDIPTSAPLLTLDFGRRLNLFVPAYSSTQSNMTMFLRNITGQNGPNVSGYTGKIFLITTPNGGSIKSWALVYRMGDTSGNARVEIHGYSTTTITSATAPVYNSGTLIFNVIAADFRLLVGFSLSQSGSTTTWRLTVTPFSGSPDSLTGSVSNSGTFAPQMTVVQISPFADCLDMAAGHILVQNQAITSHSAIYSAYDGFPGETPVARLQRLGSAQQLPVSVLDATATQSASIADVMGPQYFDTLTNLVREIEATGQGFVFDGMGPGITYATKKYREKSAGGPATLSLDAAQGHLVEPFGPVEDDLLTVNEVVVTQRSGTTAAYSDMAGPLGINAIGAYSTTLQVNPATDVGLEAYPQALVQRGTQPGYRYPTVSIALETNPGLIASWLACTPQSRIDVLNIAAIRRQHSPDPIRLLLEGWREEIGAFTWRVTANTSRAEPWNVVVLAAATGSTGDGICRMDTDSSQLNASVAAGATSVVVRTNTGPRWVSSGEDADSFPIDITIGGVRATVTAISGTSSPQTFTLSGPLPRAFTGSTTTGAGAPVAVWKPPVLGL